MRTSENKTPNDKGEGDNSPKESDYRTAGSSGLLKRVVDGATGEHYTATESNSSPERLEDRMNLIPTTPLDFLPLPIRVIIPTSNNVTIEGGSPSTPYSVGSASAYHTPVELKISGVSSSGGDGFLKGGEG